MKERRAAEAEARKGRAELDKMTRAEGVKAIEGGTRLFGEEATRRQQREISEATLENQRKIAEMNKRATLEAANISANRPTDMRSFVADYVEAARANGDTRPDAVVRQEGGLKYIGAQREAALQQAGAATQNANIRALAEANDIVNARIGIGGTDYSKYATLQGEDRKANRASGAKPGDANYQDTAGAYREKLLQEALGGRPVATGSTPPATPAGGAPATPPALQSAIPSGAIQMLKNNPTDDAKRQFDQVFGAGAAARVLGNR
jgi:hypothetical protein